MAGDWIKMRTNLWTDPRVVRVSNTLKTGRTQIIGGLFRLWSLGDEHSEDGVLQGYSAKFIDQECGLPGFAKALQSVGWLSISHDSVSIPRFEEHNGQSARRRAQDAQRKSVPEVQRKSVPEVQRKSVPEVHRKSVPEVQRKSGRKTFLGDGDNVSTECGTREGRAPEEEKREEHNTQAQNTQAQITQAEKGQERSSAEDQKTEPPHKKGFEEKPAEKECDEHASDQSRVQGKDCKPKRQASTAAGSRKSRPGSVVRLDDLCLPTELDTPEGRAAVEDWLAYKRAKGQGYKRALDVNRLLQGYARDGPEGLREAVDHSMGNNYAGLFRPHGGAAPVKRNLGGF